MTDTNDEEECPLSKLKAQDNKTSHFSKPQPYAELKAKILEAVKAGRPVERPKSTSEVDFDIEDPRLLS